MRIDPALATLETERLLLRLPEDGDLDAWFDWHQDAQTQAGLGLPRAPPRWEVWRWLAMLVGHWQLRGFGLWTLVEKSTGRLVGRAGLHEPLGWPETEVGWLIAPEARGQGYATEVGQAAARCAFEVLGKRQICSLISPENAKSIGVALRLGERFERMVTVRDVELAMYTLDATRWSAGPPARR